jgi:hypothetical protein
MEHNERMGGGSHAVRERESISACVHFLAGQKGDRSNGKEASSQNESNSPVHIPHAYQNKSPPRTIRPTLAYRMHRRTIHDEDLAERSGCAEESQSDTAPTGEIVRE